MEIAWAQVTCLLASRRLSEFRSTKTQLQVMENSDAMRRYPLHTTPYFRRSSTIFSPSVPSSHFNSPIQGSTPRITDNCRCPCTCANELSNLSSAGDPDPITRTSRKRWQDDDKENEAMLPSLPPQKKQRLYAERRLTNEKLQNVFQTIDDASWSIRFSVLYISKQGFQGEGCQSGPFARQHCPEVPFRTDLV